MPKQKIVNLWLYLKRRDSTGIKILLVLKGRSILPTRIFDLSSLRLPFKLQQQVERIVEQEKMLWEPWIEPAEDFQELAKLLKKRGITGLPLTGQPFINSTSLTIQEINVEKLPKERIMVRKQT